MGIFAEHEKPRHSARKDWRGQDGLEERRRSVPLELRGRLEGGETRQDD